MKEFLYKVKKPLIQYKSSIRNKSDIINLIINIVKMLIIEEPQIIYRSILNDDEVLVKIYIDKMSRVFIVEENKIQTFQFPFIIKCEERKLHVFFENYELDNISMAILTYIFWDFDDNKSIEQLIYKYWESIEDFNLDNNKFRYFENMITFLLSFEPGYLRFDYDSVRYDENLHPLNHIDLYYNNCNTFKIGVKNYLEVDEFIDIINITTRCRMLD